MIRVHQVVSASGATANWYVDSPTPGVVLLDVNVNAARALSPLHWRMGAWSKPPLDIQINPANGKLQGLQFVLQDEIVLSGDVSNMPNAAPGLPVFNTAEWPNSGFIDERREVGASRTPAAELALSISDNPAVSASSLPGRLVISYTKDRRFKDVLIGPLSRGEWELIGSLLKGN